MSTVRDLSVSLRANTQNFERGMKNADLTVGSFSRNVARGMRSAGTAISAIAATAASADKSFLALGASLLTAFAAGGPWGLAIAGIGAGIGLLVGKAKDAEKPFDESMKRMAESVKKFREEMQKASEAIFIAEGGSKSGFALSQVDAAIKRQEDLLVRIRQDFRLSGEEVAKAQELVRQKLRELAADRMRLVVLARMETQATEATAVAAERIKAAVSAGLPGLHGFPSREDAARSFGLLGRGFTPGDNGAFGTGKLTGAWDIEDFGGQGPTSTVRVIDEAAEAMDRLNAKAAEAAGNITNFLMGAFAAGRDVNAQLQNMLGLLTQLASQQIYRGLFTALGGTYGTAQP